MLLTKEIKISPTSKNITHYRNLGYNVKIGDEIIIKPEHLPKKSKIRVFVECEKCGKKNEITYYSYTRNITNSGYYGCGKCSNEKAQNTCMGVYGVKHATQSQNIINKTKKTNQERWGVDWVVQNEDVKQKIEDSNIERYGVKSYLQTVESRKKMIEYFDEHMGDIQDKREKTNMDRYGHSTPLQSEKIKNKIKETKEIRYGDEYFNNRKLYKETCLRVYGVDNPMKNEEIQNRLKCTLVERYGVEYPAQNPNIFLKMLKSGYLIKQYKDSDIYYQGTYEEDFLNRYYHIGITRGECIEYEYQNNKHIYFPDFYFEPLNLIIEIKSSMWYEEHKEKNEIKRDCCIQHGYNFLFIIDKNYDTFDKLIKPFMYKENHCYQYEIKLRTGKDDIKIDKVLKVSDFVFEYIDSIDREECNNVVKFIEKYEWLGKMPSRPTHRFVAKYNGIIGGVVVLSTPNTFSKMLGDDTDKIEKQISRGATTSWAPKNLASSLIMWAIKWMVSNTEFRLFSAYSDTEAREIGTIYQACNFYYIGKNFGARKLYFDLNNPNIGWVTSRTFNKRSSFKKYAKILNIKWQENWSNSTRMLWNNIPNDIEKMLREYSKLYISNLLTRQINLKHKYVYVLGKDKRETRKLRKQFLDRNMVYDYEKR
jgi:hypothetical protein